MKHFFLWWWVILLGISPSVMATPIPVTVAAVLSTTGIAAPHNLPLIPLIELAVDEINSQGGVLGHPLKLLCIDNHSTPIGSTQAAKKAIDNHVIAVIGAHWSSHSLAMAPLLQQAKIPMISISTNPGITLVGDYIFRINFNDHFQGQMVAKFARETLGAANAVVLKNLNETYSMTLGEYFGRGFKQLGGKILLESGYKGDAVDFQSLISQIKPLHPDVVFIPGYSRDSGLFLKQTISQDLFSILLQVMDHATLTDNNGKKADFRNVIIMMTSNAGTREMNAQTIGFGDPKSDTAFKGKKAIEKIFNPEFRNRLDAIVTFKSLTPHIMGMIVDKFVKELNEQLIPRKVQIKLSPEARQWLAQKGHDPQYGARPLTRLMQTKIKDLLSDEILFGKLEKGGRVLIELDDDELTFQTTTRQKVLAEATT